MKMQYRLLAALILTVACGMAAAVPPSGSGGGYYGQAWYDSGQGSVVGPYSTWYECNQALQDTIDYNVNMRGWSVTSINPCHYNPPFGTASPLHGLSYAVDSSDPGTSQEDAERIIEKVRTLRETYMIDEYQAELRRIK